MIHGLKLCNERSQSSHSKLIRDRCNGNLHIEGFLDHGQKPDRLERITSELKVVIVPPHLIDSKNAYIHKRKSLLERCSRASNGAGVGWSCSFFGI